MKSEELLAMLNEFLDGAVASARCGEFETGQERAYGVFLAIGQKARD